MPHRNREPVPDATGRAGSVRAETYGLIVAAISLAIAAVMLGIGSNFAIALMR